MAIPNINIDYRTLAEHFRDGRKSKIAKEAFRRTRKRFEESGGGVWGIYVKAYNFDKGVKNNV